MKRIRQLELASGLMVEIYNNNHRYFGDYHRVEVEIVCEVPLREEFFASVSDMEEARSLLGETVSFRRSFQQMGVPTADLEKVVEGIIENFTGNSLPYIDSPLFPEKLIRSELAKSSRTPSRSHSVR